MADLEKYWVEISLIIQDLEEIERGNFYEETKNAGTPSAKTYARNVRDKFIKLLDKIANNKEGIRSIIDRL